jgi:hypothetical protein
VAAADNIRIAVLIDADNTSPKHAEALLEEVAKYGVPTVKRAYGDWTNSHLNGWRSELPKYAIQPMLQIANTTGKNSTDSALIIDAMDLLYSGNVDAFALVSSDSDFTSLAIRLRGSGRTVYGMGLRKTPQSLRQAVDRFIFLEDLHDGGAADDQPAAGDPADDAEPRRIPELRRLLERAVSGTSHDDGWASLSSIANHVTRVEPSFSVKDYGSSKLVDLVRAQDYLEVDQPEGGSVRVRLTTTRPSRGGAAKKTAAKKTSTRKRTAKKATKPTELPELPGLPELPEPSQPSAEPPVAPRTEPGADPSAEPPAPPTVTTRKRSERARKK